MKQKFFGNQKPKPKFFKIKVSYANPDIMKGREDKVISIPMSEEMDQVFKDVGIVYESGQSVVHIQYMVGKDNGKDYNVGEVGKK